MRAAAADAEAGRDNSPGYIHIPNCRPFVRCPLASKYERVNKIGEGAFG